jgi:hypothetical protein
MPAPDKGNVAGARTRASQVLNVAVMQIFYRRLLNIDIAAIKRRS